MTDGKGTAALIAAALLVTSGSGCGSEDPDTGSVTVTLTASGDGVGKTGNVIVSIFDCEDPLQNHQVDNSLAATTLESGVALSVPRFEGVAPGPVCVLAYLDVNGSLAVDSGDVVWLGNTSAPWPWILLVDVNAGEDTPVVLTLNAVW